MWCLDFLDGEEHPRSEYRAGHCVASLQGDDTERLRHHEADRVDDFGPRGAGCRGDGRPGARPPLHLEPTDDLAIDLADHVEGVVAVLLESIPDGLVLERSVGVS